MTWILLCISYPKYVASGEEILRARGTMRTYALTPAQKEAITGFRCLACHGSTAFPAFQRSLWLDQSDASSEASCAPACLTWRNGRSRRTAPPSASVNSGWMKFMKHIEASWLMNLGKTMESNAKHMKASSRCLHWALLFEVSVGMCTPHTNADDGILGGTSWTAPLR